MHQLHCYNIYVIFFSNTNEQIIEILKFKFENNI